MNRTMMLISAGLTAFVLVVIGGVVGQLSQATTVATTPTEIVFEATPIAVPALDPTTEALIREREAAYQSALAEANQRLAQANRQLAVAQEALNNSVAPAAAPAAPAAAPAAPAAAPAAPTFPVSPEQAQGIAQAHAGGATLTRAAELVSLQGTPAYEVLFDRGAIYIDAQTGVVLANTIAAPVAAAGVIISSDQAIAAATAYLGGGQVVKVEREREHGADVYEVKFSDGSEVYVDAASGQVVYAKVRSAFDQNQTDDDNHDDGDDDDDNHDDGDDDDDNHDDGDDKDRDDD